MHMMYLTWFLDNSAATRSLKWKPMMVDYVVTNTALKI